MPQLIPSFIFITDSLSSTIPILLEVADSHHSLN